MVTPRLPLTPRRCAAELLRKKRMRALLAALVGGLIGLSCMYFPPAVQGACHLAAKILGIVIGG